MKTSSFYEAINSARWKLSQLALAAAVSLTLSVLISACENVASYTQASLVRVIDASYLAPAADVIVEGQLIAGNVGEGSITQYGTLPAGISAFINVTVSNNGAPLVTSSASLFAGHQQSVILTDSSSAASGYQVTVLQDQNLPAPSGQSAFRFLNRATKTGAVDIYMVPPPSATSSTTSGTTSGTPSTVSLTGLTPLVTALAVRNTGTYINFPSQTLIMVITPAGVLTPMYTSQPLALTGGEVRTVLILDAQLTSNGPVEAFIASDVN